MGEKNHQVAIMGEIYSGAKRTVVWLGVNPKSDELLRRGQTIRFSNLSRRLPSMFRIDHDWYHAVTAERSLNDFDSIVWFDRIWTIQEVALARQVRVLSPRREMDYDQFMDVWMASRGAWFYYMEGNPKANRIEAIAEIRDIMKRRMKCGDPRFTPDWDPMSFLCKVTTSASSHPSDKIFALYGIMKELGCSLPEPEYGTDTGELYWKACTALMSQTRSLEPLMLVNGLHWNSDCPSWVPNFDQPYRRIFADPDVIGPFGPLGILPLIAEKRNLSSSATMRLLQPRPN
jgi:hypothetical protein